MTSITEPEDNLSDPALEIVREFQAPRALLFDAWTQPEHLSKWCCPHGFSIRLCKGELRPGGHWRTEMVPPEGKDHIAVGTYREIVRPDRLIFTHAWEDAQGGTSPQTLITISFTENNGVTTMTLDQINFSSAKSRDGHRGGWTQCIEKLLAYLSTFSQKE